MIWDLIEESTFDKYFSDPTTKITTLLLDENIITELKNQNPKLLEYLEINKHQFITELIDYVITMPYEHDSHDRCHKLPYISSQLLAIDSDLIYREFFQEGKQESQNQYWIKLLSFLDTPAAQNEILIGYFQKVMNNLYAGNKTKTTKIIGDNLQRFTNILPNGSIQDIIKKSLILLNTPQGAVIEERKSILNYVVYLFVKSEENIKSACSQILSEVIAKFQAFSSGDVLLQQLLASEKLLTIYKCQSSASVNQFLEALIKKSQQRIVNQHDQKVPLFTLSSTQKQKIKSYLQREVLNIRAISKSTGFIVNQNRQTVRKSNKSLYSLLRLISIVLEDGQYTFIDQGLLKFLWNLVSLYPYNNILQVLILKIFLSTLKNSSLATRSIFLKDYQQYLLILSKQHLTLLKHFIFTIWKQAKQYQTVTNDPTSLSQFKIFVSTYLEPLLKYQILNTQKAHKPQSKLIVDEEDTKSAPKVQQQASKQQLVQTISKVLTNQLAEQKKVDLFQQFTKIQLSTAFHEKEAEQFNQKAQNNEDTDFFNDWNLQKLQNSFQQPKKPKKDDFGDFQSFF